MPNKQIHEVSFDDLGEVMQLDICLKSALPCTYEITAHDSSGLFQGTIMKGNNIGGPLDSFHIPTDILELDQRVIGWHIIFGASENDDVEEFSATINFRQGSEELLEKPIGHVGFHKSEKIIIGFARFIQQHSTDNIYEPKPRKLVSQI
jgi:hypothetical protein